MIRFLERFLGVVSHPKPAMIFITDDPTCPCSMVLSLSSQEKSGKYFHLKSTDDVVLTNVSKELKSYKRVMVYTHGDYSKMQCFYKVKRGDAIEVKYIKNAWWNAFRIKDALIYFHVCYGARILASNDGFKELFPNWVSYNQPVMYFFSSLETIKEINRKQVRCTIDLLSKCRTARALKSGLESLYKSVEFDILNVEDKERCVIDGYTAIVAAIGHNVNALQYSN